MSSILLKDKRLSFLLVALAISTIGTTASTLGFFSYIYLETSNPFNVGLITIITLAAGAFLGPFLGVFAKKYGVFKCIIFPEVISAVLLILIPLVDHTGFVYFTALFIGLNNRLVGLSRMSIVPLLVDKNNLLHVNSVIRSINRGAMILGTVLYSLVVTKSVFAIFYIDSGTYLLSALLLFLLNISYYRNLSGSEETNEEDAKTKRFLPELMEGYKILYRNYNTNYIVFLGILLRVFYTSLPVLLLVFIKKDLFLTDREFGFLQTISYSASLIVFAMLSNFLKDKQFLKSEIIIFTNIFLFGLFILIIPLLNNIVQLYVVFSFAEMSLFIAVVFIHSLVQEKLGSNQMPLATGAAGTGFSISSIISIMIFTNLVNYIGAGLSIAIIGFGVISSTIAAIFYLNYIKKNFQKIEV